MIRNEFSDRCDYNVNVEISHHAHDDLCRQTIELHCIIRPYEKYRKEHGIYKKLLVYTSNFQEMRCIPNIKISANNLEAIEEFANLEWSGKWDAYDYSFKLRSIKIEEDM